jgi:hypothetical protein
MNKKTVLCACLIAAATLLFSLTGNLSAQEPGFGARVDLALIQPAEVNEASGLAAGRNNPGILWTHNDSGDKSRIFALNEKGELLATCYLAGIKTRDCEDIAAGIGPVAGENYLYLGDMGDNKAQHETCSIYRFIEPRINPELRDQTLTISGPEIINFRYVDGPRDAETLMADPVSGDLYIVSKRDSSSRVYRLPFPQSAGFTLTAEYLFPLPFNYAVSGDISADGGDMVIKNYQQIFYWPRSSRATVAEALLEKMAVLPYTPEPQGEAICWRLDGGGYYTLSEEALGVKPHLYFYPRLPAVQPGEPAPSDSCAAGKQAPMPPLQPNE